MKIVWVRTFFPALGPQRGLELVGSIELQGQFSKLLPLSEDLLCTRPCAPAWGSSGELDRAWSCGAQCLVRETI